MYKREGVVVTLFISVLNVWRYYQFSASDLLNTEHLHTYVLGSLEKMSIILYSLILDLVFVLCLLMVFICVMVLAHLITKLRRRRMFK